MMSLRTTSALVALALAATGVAGCRSETPQAGPGGTTATVTAPPAAPITSKLPSPKPSDTAFKKAEVATRKWATALPINGDVSGDFMTRDYISKTNAARKAATAAGIRTEGDAKLVSITPVDYSESTQTTSMRVCSEGDVRLIGKDGKDVTYDSQGKKVPAGVKKSAVLVQLTTPDAGSSWQVNSVQNEGSC